MIILYRNVAINLDNVLSFWVSNEVEGVKDWKAFIKFSTSCNHLGDDELLWLPFNSEEERDQAFADILFAYRDGKKVFGIINTAKEEEKNDQ